MAITINPTITDAGLAASVDADANSLQISITHVALGTGAYAPTGSETALLNRLEKVAISSGSTANGPMLDISVLFPSYGGAGYDAKEIGFYIGDPDAGGVLFAVFSHPTNDGFVFRSSLDFLAQFSIGITRVPEGSVTVSIDPAAAVLHALIDDHKDELDPHPAYLKGSAMAGAVMMFARATAPAGWLKANGSAVSRAAYIDLFTAIGVSFGAGDGSTTFNLPDLRGEFPRFTDDGRGIDAGRQVGTAQGFQNADHGHGATMTEAGTHTHVIPHNYDSGTAGDYISGNDGNNNMPGNASPTAPAGGHVHSITILNSGGNEARPRNVALLACIKY